jgi:cell division protein FtsI/penicillin-binding protein 2
MRLYFLQIVQGDEYARDAEGQYAEAAPDTEARGNIYFTTKSGQPFAAAVMQSGWRIAIVPKDLKGAQATYDALANIVALDHDRFFQSAAKMDDPYEEVAFRISDADATKIRALKLPGVLLVQDQWRSYPGGELASQTLGFVAYKGDTKVGVYGLERQWQDTLALTSIGTYVNPFAEIFANVRAAMAPDVSKEEGSVVTTIEPTAQSELEKTLDGVMRTYTPRLAGGIVMDPHTGEIVAMATRPDFDPNTYNTVANPAVYSNQLVEGRYELGSIMKALTMAAGIDSGAVTTQTTYNDTGCITLSGKKVCNYDFRARGVIPMQEVLNQSLNVGATFVQQQMGKQAFTSYMQQYGFDTKTGIDLPNEVTGSLATLGNGSGPDVNFSTASFGQGVSVSPIEMIRALASLANGGVLPSPHVVKAIQLQSGITRAIPTPEGIRVLSATTTQTVTNMLIKVYDDALLNGAIKQEHYSIAAKTGTAQIAIPGGGYYDDRYLHSFFGYFPAHDPKFIIFLFAVEPHGVEYASASLAHPFDTLARFLINYYDIPPDR